MTYSPKTQESCTLTDTTITLTGAVNNMNPFSGSFEDGDQVSYDITDLDSDESANGIGIWNTGNTITRTDTWTATGGVVDKNPSANLSMTGGDYVTTCVVPISGLKAPSLTRSHKSSSNKSLLPLGCDGGGDSSGQSAVAVDNVLHVPILVPARTSVTAVVLNNVSSSGAGDARLGMSSMNMLTGQVLAVMEESGDLDVSSTGGHTFTFASPVWFEKETIVFAWISSDAAITIDGWSRNDYNYVPEYPTSIDGTLRCYNAEYMSTTEQPAYPASPIDFETIGSGACPAIYLKYA